MSGLLRRLAGQALSARRPSIRPLPVRLSGGASPEPMPVPGEEIPRRTATVSEGVADRSAQSSRASQTEKVDALQTETNEPPVAAAGEAPPTPPGVDLPAPVASPDEPRQPVSTTDHHRSPRATRPMADRRAQGPVSDQAAERDTDAAADAGARPVSAAAVTQSDEIGVVSQHYPTAEPAAAHETRNSRQEFEAASRVPEPLLPESGSPAEIAPSPPVEPAARGRVPREPPRPAFDQQANEVHVHIGRVEVTAVSEAAVPPRKRSRPQRQPMSLDDYLAKRQRDRS